MFGDFIKFDWNAATAAELGDKLVIGGVNAQGIFQTQIGISLPVWQLGRNIQVHTGGPHHHANANGDARPG